MIVLDTNVVSELMRPAPDPGVVSWVAGPELAKRGALWLTAVSEAELRLGVALMPVGARASAVGAAVAAMLAEDFAGRILPFDGAAARAYAAICVGRRAGGRPIAAFDAMIAAIALAHGATVATRNLRDFEGCGVDLVNPWATG